MNQLNSPSCLIAWSYFLKECHHLLLPKTDYTQYICVIGDCKLTKILEMSHKKNPIETLAHF